MRNPTQKDLKRPDEQLAILAQEGHTDAAYELVVRYTPLVTVCAKRFWGAGPEFEDLVQEGMIGLLSAVNSYRPESQNLFKTFATHCITNRILSALKAYRRGKNQMLNHHALLEELENAPSEGAGASLDPQEIFIQQEEHSRRRQQISTLLSSFEQQALEGYLQGKPYQEIAAGLGCSTKAVDNALQRVRRKLHTAG